MNKFDDFVGDGHLCKLICNKLAPSVEILKFVTALDIPCGPRNECTGSMRQVSRVMRDSVLIYLCICTKVGFAMLLEVKLDTTHDSAGTKKRAHTVLVREWVQPENIINTQAGKQEKAFDISKRKLIFE